MVPGSWDTHPKTNMTGFEHPPFEDVFPIEHGGFSNVMLVFSSWLGSYLFGTFKGISKDSADFFSQAWFKKDPPCQPWWFWTYLKRAKRNGVWISCYFPTHTFFLGTLPKSSMRKTLGAKHELRIHQFQWCVCAKKTRHRWLKCSINTARYRVNSYTIYYIYLLYIYTLVLSFVVQIIIMIIIIIHHGKHYCEQVWFWTRCFFFLSFCCSIWGYLGLYAASKLAKLQIQFLFVCWWTLSFRIH